MKVEVNEVGRKQELGSLLCKLRQASLPRAGLRSATELLTAMLNI